MKTTLFTFIFILPLIVFGQMLTFEDDFSTMENWSIAKSSANLNVTNHALNFSTKKSGSTIALNSVMVDYTKDFNLSFDVVLSSSIFYILLNSSGDGYDNIKIGISSYFYSISKWKDDKEKSLKKGKFKSTLKFSEGIHVSISQKNGVLLITVLDKPSNETITLFSDDYPIEPNFPTFGFRLYEATKSIAISVSNFKLEYYPFSPKDIHLLAHYEKFGNKVNLGRSINGSEHEIGQVVSADGELLLYTWDDDERQIPYYSTYENGNWTNGKPVSESLFNPSSFNSITSISGDKNTIFMNGEWSNGIKISSNGISKSERTKYGWSSPKSIKVDGFETKGDLANCISSDQRFLISTLDNKESKEKDLFVFFRMDDGSYGKRLNLGTIINTSKNESTPFLAPDNKTLYFSSDGHPGYGAYDIFISRRLDDTWTNWSEPENLGPKINTPDWDGYYCVSAKGDYAYMTTYWQTLGLADIVRIELPQEAKPEKMIIIKGKVLNKITNEPIGAEIRFNEMNTNDNPGIGISDPTTGDYQVVLSYGEFFQLYAQKEGYYALSDQIDLREKGDFKIVEKNIYLTPIKVGEVFRLNNLFFETASAELKPESYQELERLVKFLNENPTIKIKIAGHTDNVGSDKDNLELSQNRAAAVEQFLKQATINLERISSEGFGEGKPLESNETEEGRRINRRVEFTIISN